MEVITKTEEELAEMDLTSDGQLIKELLEKINEIIEWINKQ